MPKKWTAHDVLALAGSYQPVCVLVAAAELDLFGILADYPLNAEEVADRLGLDTRATTILLDALAGLELLDKREDRYALPESVARVLTHDGSPSVLPMAQHQARCFRQWAQLAKVVQSGKPAERQPSILGEAGDRAAFIGAMHSISAPIAAKLIDDLQPLEFTHLLDIGGASGTWTIAFLRANPDAVATLFDLPQVIPLADERIAEAGLSRRVELVAGDYLVDSLPEGVDLAWVSDNISSWSREQNRLLFSRAFEALVDGGRIIIRDVIMDESRTAPLSGALFAVNMLVSSEGGRTFTFDELREDIEAAGFVDATMLRPNQGSNSIISATKPL